MFHPTALTLRSALSRHTFIDNNSARAASTFFSTNRQEFAEEFRDERRHAPYTRYIRQARWVGVRIAQ
jgi:hypothetical protein